MQIQEHNSKRWWALAGMSLSSFLGCIDFTIVNTGLPNIQADLSATVTQLQWIINIFLVALAALMVIMGRLSDLYGRRRALYIGMLVFGLASLGAGLSPNIHWLIFFRFAQAIGVAILYTVPVAIISSMFPINERAKATGILFGVNGFGLAIGPVVGGFIISALSWRWIFFVNLPIVIISFLMCVRTVIESKSSEHGDSIDWLGFILLAISFPLLILTTVQASSWGWNSPLVYILYAVALACLVLFYFVEKHSKSPIIKLNLLANRIFIVGATANMLLAFFYTVAFFILPLYLHSIMGQSSDLIGLTLLPATLLVALLSPVVGHTVEKYGVKINLMFGFVLFALSAYLQTRFSSDTHLTFIITALIFLGIGWAFILSPSFIAALMNLPESVAGVGMGAMGTLHNFGGALGLALGTLLYHHQAKVVLLEQSVKQNFPTGSWMEQAISKPEDAVQTIVQATHLDTNSATRLFMDFFTHSFSSLMWLLVGISVAGFLVILLGLKRPNKKI
ncbi:MAG TPA: MFS transporter [Gammaproteobacteria bacterium]|nr:MFS transporter [Gammaproteobacteria bacterium]